MMQRTYLDYNATSILHPSAKNAMLETMDFAGNASSIHAEGRKARAIIEKSRKQVAQLVNSEAKNVIFTSGGTEANMMVMTPDLVSANKPGSATEKIKCFISSIEHPCVLSGGRFQKHNMRYLEVSGEGVIKITKLKEVIEEFQANTPVTPFLISVMLANNETGARQPISEISEIVHDAGGLLHVDAVQAAGKISIDSKELGVDFLTLSSHKIGGPQGVGALILGSDKLILGQKLMKGGGQELNRRAGTENIIGIAGFGAAAEQAFSDLAVMSDIERLRDDLEKQLLAISPEAFIFSLNVPRLPNTSCLSVAGMTAEMLLIAFDLKGIAVSSGSACSSGKVEQSHVLKAMGIEKDLSKGAIRISLGWKSSQVDIERFINVWSEIYKKFKNSRQAA